MKTVYITKRRPRRFPSILIFVILLGGVHQFFALNCPDESMPREYCVGCHDTVPSTLYHKVWCNTSRWVSTIFKSSEYLYQSKKGTVNKEEMDTYMDEFMNDYNLH